ncbi:MAG: thymidylate synthase [Candidatus Brocadiia bacterium]
MSDAKEGSIPVLHVAGANIPEAWEKAVLAVWDNGVEVKTEYDKPEETPSLDATVSVEVADPLGEPRIHKNFPGGPTELEAYRQEVVEGIHDHWIDPAAGKWTYTYHQRLFSYRPLIDLVNPEAGPQFPPVNQVQYIIEKLADVPYSRRAQGITWIPHCDPGTDDPPCLQRIWARLLRGEEGFVLNMNSHWRSRDLLLAWFMNVYALTDLQRIIAERLADMLGEPVRCGRYVDVSDSLHVYGQYRDEHWEGEVQKMRASPYTERAWETSMLEPMFEEARANLEEDPDYYARGDSPT